MSKRYAGDEEIHTVNDYEGDSEEYEKKQAMKFKRIQKKRRAKRRNQIIFGFFVILAMVAGWGIATVETQIEAVLNQVERNPKEALSSVNVDETKLNSDKEIINILLIGADKRVDWAESGRSDSAMIATLDLKNKRLKLTSLMRDMYVAIPGHGEDRFNAAYSYGGVALVYQTIATNFGLKLDGYAVVDFAAFKEVINTIGGVEIELTDKEHTYLTTAYKKGSVLKLQPGLNNMNGTQALAYTRIRQDAKGDFGRTERQRKVLQSIFTKAKSMSLSELISLTEAIMPYIATDLENSEILAYVRDILLLGTTEIDQFRIPMDDTYTQKRIDNKAVLIPDIYTNTNALHDFIFNYNGN